MRMMYCSPFIFRNLCYHRRNAHEEPCLDFSFPYSSAWARYPGPLDQDARMLLVYRWAANGKGLNCILVLKSPLTIITRTCKHSHLSLSHATRLLLASLSPPQLEHYYPKAIIPCRIEVRVCYHASALGKEKQFVSGQYCSRSHGCCYHLYYGD